MPKLGIDFPERVTFRITEKNRNDFKEIGGNSTEIAREAFAQYLPIKKLLLNPMAVPRSISVNDSTLVFGVTESGALFIDVNGEIIELDHDNIKHVITNLFMFNLTNPDL